jgi:hypothetical protein
VMALDKKKGIRDHVRDATDIAKDIVDLVEDGIGIAASPAMLWLLVLKTSYCGNGFSGFKSNRVDFAQAQYVGTGGNPNQPPTKQPPTFDYYRGWYLGTDGLNWFIYYKDASGGIQIASGAFNTEALAKAYIDAISG